MSTLLAKVITVNERSLTFLASCRRKHELPMIRLDGFEGNFTSGKAAQILKTSQPTVNRMLSELVGKGLLKVKGAGRSTHYVLTSR